MARFEDRIRRSIQKAQAAGALRPNALDLLRSLSGNRGAGTALKGGRITTSGLGGQATGAGFYGPTGFTGAGPTAPTGIGGGGGGGGNGATGVGRACNLIQNPTLRELCFAGVEVTGIGSGGGGGKPSTPGQTLAPTSCPPGRVRVGDQCVDPSAAFPGGVPFTTPAGGQTTMGAFGMPAVVPEYEQRIRRDCPEGMVLGKDDLCYPKAILSRRSRFRKWRQPRRPLFTAGDLNAIRRAERLKGKAKELGKDLGFKVTNK